MGSADSTLQPEEVDEIRKEYPQRLQQHKRSTTHDKHQQQNRQVVTCGVDAQ